MIGKQHKTTTQSRQPRDLPIVFYNPLTLPRLFTDRPPLPNRLRSPTVLNSIIHGAAYGLSNRVLAFLLQDQTEMRFRDAINGEFHLPSPIWSPIRTAHLRQPSSTLDPTLLTCSCSSQASQQAVQPETKGRLRKWTVERKR